MSNNRTILSRPRTKIYDSNYNIGESYYKSTLDRLDRKYSGRPLTPPRQSSPGLLSEIGERHSRAFADEDIEDSRRRASNKIRENHLFDSRGARLRRDNFDEDDDGINNETASALQRIRASKKVSYVDDVDLESTSNNLRSQRLLDRSEKILDSIGLNESASSARKSEYSFQKRALKMSYDADADNLTKWSSIKKSEIENNDLSSAAAVRARKSRAKIEDIDEEMAAMQEKQQARERRVARLKQLVAECDSETVDDNGVASIQNLSITEKKVRF